MTELSGFGRTVTVTVLFCDLVGSTERQSRLGDDATDRFRRAFFDALRAAVGRAHGEVVKNLGDGLMVVFRHSTVDAVACAVDMHDSVAGLDDQHPVQIRVGIGAGEVAHEEADDDWFGTPVNEAARLCARAKTGQTLVTDTVRSLVGSRGEHRFRSIGSLALKGLPAPVRASEVVSAEHADTPDSRRRRSPLVAAAIAALAVVVIAGAVALATRQTHGHAATQRPGPNAPAADLPPAAYNIGYVTRKCPKDVTNDVADATCGTLTVPEDRAHADNGRAVKLLVTRVPARGPATGVPVVDFGVDPLAKSTVRDHADEIQLAPRGFGGSTPLLTCPEYRRVAPDALTRPARDPRNIDDAKRALGACRTRLVAAGVNLDKYTLVDSGDDMIDLMRALHFPRVDLVSGYVATIAALEVLRVVPNAVHTLTLQSPVVPGRSSSTDPAAYMNAALARYIALCHDDAWCAHSYPDLSGEFELGYEFYDRSPRIAHGDDGDGHTHDVLLDGPRIAQAVWNGLFNRDVYPLLASGIDQASSAVVDDLIAGQVVGYSSLSLEPDFAWGALLSVRCSYDFYTIDPGHELSDRQLPAYSGVDDRFFASVCPVWKVAKLPEFAFDTDRGYDVPTLIVQGALSPNTLVEWGADLRQQMPHSTVITFPTLDGQPLSRGGPPCLGDIRSQFLADPSASLDVAACEKQSPKIRFVAS